MKSAIANAAAEDRPVSAWTFPVEHTWQGPLRDIAELFTANGMPSNDDLEAAVRELGVDTSAMTRTGVLSARERSAVYDLQIGLTGRSWRRHQGGGVTVDGRCLGDPQLAPRGIGRHARRVLEQLCADAAEGLQFFLVVDDPDISVLDGVGLFGASVTLLRADTPTHEIPPTEVFVSLSPLTSRPLPAWIMRDARAYAVVYDLIPLQYPHHYHKGPSEMLEYGASLCWLRTFDELWAISAATADHVAWLVAVPRDALRVTGVESSIGASASFAADHRRLRSLAKVQIALCGGGDTRKNMLAPVDGLRSIRWRRFAVHLIGVLPQVLEVELRSHEQLASRHTVARSRLLTDDAVGNELRRADLVVVPSHAEGYSLPVAEALQAGTPVLASRIPAHHELLGDGPWLVDADDPAAWASGIAEFLRSGTEWHRRQAAHFVAARAKDVRPMIRPRTPVSNGYPNRSRKRPTLAIITPLPPQESGVADYSASTLRHLGSSFDVSLVVGDSRDASDRQFAPVRDQPVRTAPSGRFDLVLHVVGNSHFHVPALEHLERFGGAALAHDNRLLEVYSRWKGVDAAAEILAMSGADIEGGAVARFENAPHLLPDLGFGAVARRASPLIVHSTSLAERIALETGTTPIVLPFSPYRIPDGIPDRRNRLTSTLVVASFGEVSIASKRNDLLVESLAWLRDRGVDARLVFVGEASRAEAKFLGSLSADLGLTDHFEITGRVSDAEYRSWLGRVDAAVQVRSSSVLTLSGAALDAIAFGVPLVTTEAMSKELGAAPDVFTVPDPFSSFLLAEALEAAQVAERPAPDQLQAFLAERSPAVYSRLMAEVLLERC